MPKSGSYHYPGVQTPNSSYPSVDIRELTSAPSTGDGVGKLYTLSVDKDLYFKDSAGNEIAVASAGPGSSNVFGDVYVSGTLYASGSIINPEGDLILSSSSNTILASGSLVVVPSSGISRVLAPTPATEFGFYIQGQSRFIIRLATIDLGLDARILSNRRLLASDNLILSSSGGSIIAMSGALKHEKRTAATMPVGSVSMSGAVVWVDDTKTLAVYGPLGWTRILTGSVI